MHNRDIVITFISLLAILLITKMTLLTIQDSHKVNLINNETWETNEHFIFFNEQLLKGSCSVKKKQSATK